MDGKIKEKRFSFFSSHNSSPATRALDHSLFETIVIATGYESLWTAFSKKIVDECGVCACFVVFARQSNSLPVTGTQVFTLTSSLHCDSLHSTEVNIRGPCFTILQQVIHSPRFLKNVFNDQSTKIIFTFLFPKNGQLN